MVTGRLRRWMLCFVAAASSMVLAIPSFSEPVDHFVGELVLRDIDPKGRNFELEQPFGYIDPSGTRWQAEKGLVTDGASIPWPLWSIIGGPFEGEYRRAAIIHDFYCDRKYRSWKRTHRVFYDAMITGGVSLIKAKLMYYAVWRFGPRWAVTEIVPCVPDPSIGKYCASVKATSVEFSVEQPIVEEKDVTDAKAELDAVANQIDREGLSVEQLEQLADSKPAFPRIKTITRRATILTTAPPLKYEDFNSSETPAIVPDNEPVPGLFPSVNH
jgi:hypothetical protein